MENRKTGRSGLGTGQIDALDGEDADDGAGQQHKIGRGVAPGAVGDHAGHRGQKEAADGIAQLELLHQLGDPCLAAANIDAFFADDEIDLLYINFCDPWPRKKNAKRRLTYHTFLEKYKKVLKLGGQIHFKTDNAKLFDWSLPEMESCFLELHNVTHDLHANGPVGIMTGYEEKFYGLGTPINRVEAVVVTKQPRPEDLKDEAEDSTEAGEDAE